MEFTFQKLLSYNDSAGKFLERNPEDSKIGYAIKKKILPQLEKIFNGVNKRVQRALEDNAIEFALEEKGKLVREEDGRYCYSKADLKLKVAKDREINDEHQTYLETVKFELEPYYATSVPELTWEEEEDFLDIIIKEKSKE